MGYKKILRSNRRRAKAQGYAWGVNRSHPRDRYPVSGRKRSHWKADGHYLKGVRGFVGKHKTTATRANRQERHRIKTEIRP